MEKLFLIDAYALIFRFHYAFIARPMRSPAGINTSAIFGFAKFLGEIIDREHPHYLGVAFDPGGENFRHKLYPAYKANRDETPEDIKAAVPWIKEILKAMHIPSLVVEGYEADDVIGTLSHKASCCGQFEVYMVTPDKDYGQLIKKDVSIYKPGKGGEGMEIIGLDKVCENYGISDPKQVIDILALWGDASDNIPGVPGIGEKGAKKLVGEWGTIDRLLANTDKLTPKLRESLLTNRGQLELARTLVTIDLDVPVEFEPDALKVDEPDWAALRAIYLELGFTSLLRNIDSHLYHAGRNGHTATDDGLRTLDYAAAQSTGKPAVTAKPKPYSQLVGQMSLFGDEPLDAGEDNGTSPYGESNGTNASFDASDPAGAPLLAADGTPLRDIRTQEHQYHTVTDDQTLAAMVQQMTTAGAFAFDTETSALDPLLSDMIGLSFSAEAHTGYWVPTPMPGDRARVLKALKPLFENASIAKVAQNAKYDIEVIHRAARQAGFDIELKGELRDTMVVHYLLDPEARHNMDFLSENLLRYAPVPIEALIGKGAKQLSMRDVPAGTLAEYAAEDADVTWQLGSALMPKLAETGQTALYHKIEEPLIGVLARVEENGVYVAPAILERSGAELRAEAATLEEDIRTMAGIPNLNVGSPKQLGEVLFDKLKITDKPKRTKTKLYSTDEEYLTSLSDKHPIIGKILEYRGLKKLLSTYIDALPTLINPETGRIHTSFNQTVTSTGRLSSTNPNVQNIPIRDEAGREIRKAFTTADPSARVILAADYSQIELRIMAHLSGDEALRQAFLDGEDIHTATAAKIFGVAPEEVTREQRRRAKTANFGIIYGISAFGLSQRLAIPRAEAKELIDGYFKLYPGVQHYMSSTIELGRQQGYVETLFGRRRYVPDLHSANAATRGLAERTAINTPIQGTAADIMKIAMIEVDRRLRAGTWDARIVLQVHDELVLEVSKTDAEAVQKMVVEAMSSAAELAVPLAVDAATGPSWFDAH